MKILYIDPISGISGDMMIAAFLDLGLPLDAIASMLDTCDVCLPQIKARKKRHGIISGVKVDFEGEGLEISPQRITKLIEDLKEDERVKRDALSMLDILIDAECVIHEQKREELHFHELSDTFIDFLSVAKAVSYFGIEKIYCGPIPFGHGTIKTSHGLIPNPPPLTTKILNGFPVYFTEMPFELVTPTGAVIIKYYAKKGPPPPFKIEREGVGFGSYEMGRPDVLRLFLGEVEGEKEEVWILETDIDDMEMEYVGAIADRIRKKGAKDVIYFPVYMKKGRVGIRICVIVSEREMEDILDVMFLETSTFGIRMRKEGRRILKREERTVETDYGSVRIKVGYGRDGKVIKKHVEFEDVKEIAERLEAPLRNILEDIKSKV